MKVFISVVSHGHSDLIKELACLKSLAQSFNVVVKENSLDDSLREYCEENNIVFIENNKGLGFGANNNQVFEYCKTHLNMVSNDCFIVLNPDVKITCESIDKVIEKLLSGSAKLLGINLFKDENLSEYDNSVRKFPNLLILFRSFLGMGNDSIINKSLILTDEKVDWFAGSFMAFVVSHYENLNGFDERYHMYCEDVDICYRSKKIGVEAQYTPDIKAIHYAQHNNKKIFSKHFYWHVKSAFIFEFQKIKYCLSIIKE